MTTLIKNRGSSLVVGVSLAILLVGAGVLQMRTMPLFSATACYFGALVLYFLYSSGAVAERAKLYALAIIGFFFAWTLLVAADIGRSALGMLNIAMSTLVYFGLHDQQYLRLKHDSTQSSVPLFNIFKIILLAVALAHASALAVGYLMLPDQRWSGLFLDYSHAAIFILFAYALALPLVKDKSYTVGLTFILFLGFFCAFSRTGNFLLIIFTVFYVFFEWKNNRLAAGVKFLITILFALLLVYLYPFLIDFSAVDRNSISEMRTLNSRTIYWQAAINSIQANPFWGIGIGNYEYSGIKELRPFRIISSVHNDYLQIAVEFGLLWATVFFCSAAYLVTRYAPFRISSNFRIQLTETHASRQIAWLLLLCFSLYMVINFIINFFIFQLILGMIFLELKNND